MDGEYHCGTCDKKFNWKQVLKRHLKKHSDIKDGFTEHYLLKRHMKSHGYLDKLMCDECGDLLAGSGGLVNHKKSKHPKKGFLCDICEKMFHDAYHLKTSPEYSYSERLLALFATNQ
jgi:uncharacterized Zn-finger protein